MAGYVLRRLQPHAALILARHAAGETFEAIAADHGCAGSTIRRFLLDRGLTLPRAERRGPAKRVPARDAAGRSLR